MKLLVTGGAGFIGANFVKMLIKETDTEVINLDALTYAGNLETIAEIMDNPRHTFVKGDIRDEKLVNELMEGVDGVINFAAESHVDRSITGPKVFIETNINGTLNLLQAARKNNVKRYLQVSTDEVYGSLGETGMFTEETPLSPNSPYSASKASADMLVRAYHHTYGMDVITTRCSNNYGPFQFPEKMLPLMINNAWNDKALPVYGDGLHVRDWLYVYDHCTAIWAAFNNGKAGEVYNIGGCNEKTNLEVIKTMLKITGKSEDLITFVKDRPGHDRRYAIDASKTINELGWKPSVTFEEGLAKTIEWYENHREWMQHVISGEYQGYYDKMYHKGARADI